MSREIMLKWCKTKPTIESEYVRALFESCDDHLYIYMICYAKISIVIVSIFQIPKKNHKVKNQFESILSLLRYLTLPLSFRPQFFFNSCKTPTYSMFPNTFKTICPPAPFSHSKI